MPFVLRSSLLVLAAAPAAADESGAPAPPRLTARQRARLARQARIALAVVDRFVVPAYLSLAEATASQEKAWAAFAANRQASDIEMLRFAYNNVCDAWANAQLIKTGPITLFLRADRFAYWPEARNATQRALDQLLASSDLRDLTPEVLAHDSVAGQGLTALERLLYDGEEPSALLKAHGKDGVWRVQVGLGIARNLALIARDVLRDWTAQDGVRSMIAENKGWKNLFADAPEAARLLLTDVVSGFKLMHDVKLLPVMSTSIELAKPRLAEAWRSGRSARDLRLNLAAAQEMTDIFAETVLGSHRRRIEVRFLRAFDALDELPADMGAAAADPELRPRVEAARAAIKTVQTEIAATLPVDLGITLGFNSLDGD